VVTRADLTDRKMRASHQGFTDMTDEDWHYRMAPRHICTGHYTGPPV